jgi:hypothetical protein
MRKVFLFLLVLVVFKSSQAQQAKPSMPKSILVFPDTSIFLHFFPNYNRLKYTTYNMPNTLKGMDNQLTKIGSNYKGIDLYQSKLDNMIVLKPTLVFPDTSIFVYSFPNYNRLKYTTDNMPNPIKGMDNQLTKIGSNNRGFDLYQSNQDNMFVLKPDNQNLASNYIPNALKTLPPFLQKPDLKGLPKLNALVDSLAHTK